MKISYLSLAKKYIKRHYCSEIKEIERLATGLCHYVYCVRFDNDHQVVIRVAREESKDLIRGGVYWNKYLSGLELPMPKLLHYDTDEAFPYMIIEKFSGKDLCYVYDDLNMDERVALARQVADLQLAVSKLQPNNYYGYAECYFDEKLTANTSWKQVIHSSIMRSKKRIDELKVFDSKYAELVLSKMNKFSSYLERIKPKPFLDDITTKNVLIDNGKLSGIVDIDEICFGDRLFHVALTRMALISQKSDTDYIDYILEEYNLEEEHYNILDFYTLVCCLDFMSEVGQIFNKEETLPIDEERVEFLETIFDKYYKSENIMMTDLMRYGASCQDFYNEKIISDIVRVVKQGKEATVVCCKSHESMDSKYMAVKLYKEKKFRNFKRDKVYHIGRIWDQRLMRAIRNKSKIGQDAERASWVTNEFASLARLYQVGVNVPKPIAHTSDAIVMEFLGEEDLCSSLLKDTRFTKQEANRVFKKLMYDIEVMLANDIVHGDLSAYNILYHNEEPYIIDFPQAVNPAINTYAFDLLERDVANLCKHFKRYNIEANPEEIARIIWTNVYSPYARQEI